MWAQVPDFSPQDWGPVALAMGLVFSFIAALATRKIRWGSDYDDLQRRLDAMEKRAMEAEARERVLIEKKDDEIARIRDRIEEKLSRANDVLSATADALRNRG